MKVLMIVFNQISQGTYWRALRLGVELVKKGHQVTLIGTSRKARWKLTKRFEEGVEIIEAPDLFTGSLRSGWDLWNTFVRIAFLGKKRFDIVHAFESRPTVIFPALWAKAHGAILIMDWCDWFGKGGAVEERQSKIVRTVLSPVETFFEEHYRTRASASSVICTTLREKLTQLGAAPESILLLPNGTTPEKWPYQDLSKSRSNVDLPEDAFVIGYVGTMFPKDAEFMAAAFDEVARQSPEAHLLLVGYNPVNLQALCHYPERVHQTGYLADQSEIYKYLAACNVFWLPLQDSNANRGRLPFKLMDYMVAGRPVIATTVGDVANILEEEEFGFLSQVNALAFADCTFKLSQDRQLQERLGRSARAAAEGKYTWDRLATALESLYQRVLSK